MTQFDTDVQSVSMRRREIEAMINLLNVRSKTSGLTADEQAALQRFEDARMGNQMDPDHHNSVR